MESIFNEPTWEKYLEGYTIYDCAIFRQHGFCLVLVERKENRDILPRTRFLTVIYDKPISVGSLPMVEVGDFSFTTIASGVNPPEYVAVDTSSHVYSANAQRKDVEMNIDEVVDMSTVKGATAIVRRVVRAAGHIYALGSYRTIYRRNGIDRWTELRAEGRGVPLPPDIETGNYVSANLGFKDMSAFNENDMYAVGGDGDVWRFDGAKWHHCPFPTNSRLETVACGEDGKVYISDMKGCVWAGRENRWTQVAEAEFAWGSQPIDSAWFKGRLYLGSQDGLYTLGAKKDIVALEGVDSDAPGMGNCGRVDVSPDGQFLLTAGSFGATLYDGTTWTKLFSGYDFM